MPTSLTDYLDIERMLAQKLQQELVGVLDITWSAHAQAVSTGDLDTAAYLAETMSLASVEPKIREYAKLLMRAAIDFGASLASGGRTLTSSLMLDRTVDANVNQLCNYLKYGMTLQLQKHLLQLIAQDRVVHKSEGKGHAFHGNQYVDLSLSMTKDLIESAPSTPKIRHG